MNQSNHFLNALLEGNSEQIQEIYRLYFPKVRSFILNNKGQETDVHDIFHDALLYLIATAKERTLQIDSFEAYLFTICKNLWRRALKNKKNRVIKEGSHHYIDKQTDLGMFIMEQQRFDLYTEKYQELSQNCKDVLSTYFNGMSYQEILEQLEYSTINTVRQRVFKCREKLIQLIKSDPRFKKFNS